MINQCAFKKINLNYMDNNTIQPESVNTQEGSQKAIKISLKISIKTAVVIAAIIILGALAYVSKGIFIAATVDGSPISRLAVIQGLEKSSGQSLLNSLITKKLIQNEAKTKKIVVSNDEINAEIKKIEDQVAFQGTTIDAALSAQGMSMKDLKEQIVFQLEIEKLVADKINVTDEEAAQYIKSNSIPVPWGQEATTTAQVKEELRGQKLSTEGNALITSLRSQAKIRYFVNY